MNKASPARAAVAEAARSQRETIGWATFAATGAMLAGAILLALSGWFLAGAALAGAAGAGAAIAFNYMLPSALIRLLAIGRTGGRYLERLLTHAAALRTLARLRPAIFARFCALPTQRALELSSGEASTLLVQDMAAIEARCVTVPVPWAALATTAAAAGLIALASPWASLAFLACFAAFVTATGILAPRSLARPQSALLESITALKSRLHRLASGAPELLSFGWHAKAVEELMRVDDAMVCARAGIARTEGALLAARHLAAGLAMGATLLLAADRPLPLAALAVLAAAAGMEAAGALLLAIEARGKAQVAIERLDARLAQPSDARPAASAGVITIGGRSHSPPQVLGIEGPTGAGKTRLLDALRAHYGESPFAWLPQRATLLTGTVRENLAPAQEPLSSEGIGEAAMWSALEDAALAARVRELPNGLDTWIGDGGEKLSGGERRRLALARAFLKDARWLMLDEPTEGLDHETEARVVEALRARLRRSGQGALIVSHRAAPLALAQERIVLPVDPSRVVIGP